MNVIPLGQGVAPSVSWHPDGWYVAIGGIGRVVIINVSHDGINRGIVRSFPDGFGFPTLAGDWCGYKGNETIDWRARLWNLRDGRDWTFQQAGGNFPLVLSPVWFAWQLPVGYSIYRVPLASPGEEPMHVGLGAPDGLAWIDAAGQVAVIKDVRFSVPGLLNPQMAGPVTIGEQPDLGREQWPLGMAVAYKPYGPLWRGWLLGGQVCDTPRVACSPDGLQFAVVTYGAAGGVRLVLLDILDIVTLPPPPTAQTPTPTPQPQPEPTPMPTVPHAEIVRAQNALARASFPPDTPTLPELARVAVSLGRPWGLNGKRGNPDDPSRDVLAYSFGGAAQPFLFDVLLDAWDPATGKGQNGVTWGPLPYPEPAGAVWIDPVKWTAGGGTPVQTPAPARQLPADWVSLDRFVNVEVDHMAAWYREKHGADWSLHDMAFQMYRRLGPELWTMDRIHREI